MYFTPVLDSACAIMINPVMLYSILTVHSVIIQILYIVQIGRCALRYISN